LINNYKDTKGMQKSKEYIQKTINTIEKEIIKLFRHNRFRHSIIVALYAGKKLPKYCVQMTRKPASFNSIPLNNNFAKIYFSAIKESPSFKDGVILIQVDCVPPIVKGFSYRIYPPPLNIQRLINKGSGYNSSLDFSDVRNVVCVYFIKGREIKKFTRGKEELLC